MLTKGVRVRAVFATVASLVLLLLGGVVNGPGDEVNAQSASADYFLKIDGIEGESLDEGHRGEIEVDGWSWGETNSSTPPGTGQGSGKVKVNDFNFSMRGGKASPKLFLACAQGKVIPTATLTGVTSDGHTFVTWELKNVIISSYKTTGDRTTGPPTDEIRIRFQQIVVTQTVQNADGTTSDIRAGWDLATNKKV